MDEFTDGVVFGMIMALCIIGGAWFVRLLFRELMKPPEPRWTTGCYKCGVLCQPADNRALCDFCREIVDNLKEECDVEGIRD